jgi:putative membrane protein
MDGVLLYTSLAAIGLSGLSIIAGVLFIRLGWKVRHRKAMLAASVLAVFFVGIYLVRSYVSQPHQYGGEYRTFFLGLLWSHTFLAVVNLPLAVVTIYLAFKGRFETHRRIAPYTVGVWICVAASGWTVYLMNA